MRFVCTFSHTSKRSQSISSLFVSWRGFTAWAGEPVSNFVFVYSAFSFRLSWTLHRLDCISILNIIELHSFDIRRSKRWQKPRHRQIWWQEVEIILDVNIVIVINCSFTDSIALALSLEKTESHYFFDKRGIIIKEIFKYNWITIIQIWFSLYLIRPINIINLELDYLLLYVDDHSIKYLISFSKQ